jgi:hypothetical protein
MDRGVDSGGVGSGAGGLEIGGAIQMRVGRFDSMRTAEEESGMRDKR